jgi:hypothetical protein
MKLYGPPWPQEQLNQLGETEVQMRVTISYFIEPNPAESARNQKTRYCSHGLRFAVKLPDEDVADFRKRVNKAAREPGDGRHPSDTRWKLGSDLRDRGSLHSDFWRGPASDLARRGHIAVFPISGWWKEREHIGRFNKTARFSVVVSIVTVITTLAEPVSNKDVSLVAPGSGLTTSRRSLTALLLPAKEQVIFESTKYLLDHQVELHHRALRKPRTRWYGTPPWVSPGIGPEWLDVNRNPLTVIQGLIVDFSAQWID